MYRNMDLLVAYNTKSIHIYIYTTWQKVEKKKTVNIKNVEKLWLYIF